MLPKSGRKRGYLWGFRVDMWIESCELPGLLPSSRSVRCGPVSNLLDTTIWPAPLVFCFTPFQVNRNSTVDNLIADLEVILVGISARPCAPNITRQQLGPILAGRHPGPGVKGVSETTVVCKASLRGDGSNRHVRVFQLLGHQIETHFINELRIRSACG